MFRSAKTGVAITRAGFEAVLDTWNAEPDQLLAQRIRSEFSQFEAVGGRGFVSLSVLASEVTSSLPNKTKLEQMS
ncbi:conserved hypothetical protein [Roseibium sp. TrichSKD4]|nr:conserved hypothetical protein [Roseibium sp. TrichSKD4]